MVKTNTLVWIKLFLDWRPSFVAMKPAAPSTPASRGIATPKRFERASWAVELLSVKVTLSSNLARSVGF